MAVPGRRKSSKGGTAVAQQPSQPAHPVSEALRKIILELGVDFFERREVIETLVITLLAKQNGFILGPPGTAKSDMLRALCRRIIDALYYEVLLDRQLGKEELFGPIDIPEYEQSGKWQRNIDGTLADCHIAFLDEVGKAGPAVLNPMLTAMNERTFKANGKPAPIPMLSTFGASNELLEPELGAFWDRWLVRLNVDYIQEPSNFMALLLSSVKTHGQRPGVSYTTVSLPDLTDVIDNVVPYIPIPSGVAESVQELKLKLRAEQVKPSDRRMKASMTLLQASAFLNGRSAVDDDDLAILRFVLWDVAEQIPTVEKEVMSLTSPITRDAMTLQGDLEDIETEIDSRHGQSVEKRAAYGGEAQNKLTILTNKLDEVTEKSNREGRSTAKLDAIRDHLRGVKVKVLVECLNVPPDRADIMVRP